MHRLKFLSDGKLYSGKFRRRKLRWGRLCYYSARGSMGINLTIKCLMVIPNSLLLSPSFTWNSFSYFLLPSLRAIQFKSGGNSKPLLQRISWAEH